GPSMRRAMKSKMRLITLALVGIELRFFLGDLAQQVIVEHLARNRARGGAAVAAVLHQDRERQLRVVGGREGDEERMVAMLLADAALVVRLSLLHADDLRSAGLGGDHVL